ncbi:MAG: GNAT family N-acetyltransferase [Acidimicrobiia bacterium]
MSKLTELFPFTSDVDMAKVLPFYNRGQREVFPRHAGTTADQLRARNSTEMEYRFFGLDDVDGLAALGITAHFTDGSNEHLQWLQLFVRPDARRNGHGKSLLMTAVETAEGSGRTVITSDAVNTVPASALFAASSGADEGMREHINVVAVADVDVAMLARWRVQGPSRAPGYEVLQWDDDYERRYDNQVAGLLVMADEDMPFEDLDLEPQTETGTTLRERLDRQAGLYSRITSVARHIETDTLVGFSELLRVSDSEPLLNTTLTMVHRNHRGHALGKWLKADSILRGLARFPDTTHIQTENAQSNAPMLGINDAIGFVPELELVAYQATTAHLRDYLERNVQDEV